MATLAEIKKARQELIDKTPLHFQGEIFDTWGYVNGETNLNPPNTPTDFKLALIKEAVNIWDNKTYNLANISKIFKPNTNISNWEAVLKNWLNLKNTLKLGEWELKGYIERRRAMPTIYEDWNNEVKELTDAKTSAETNLKTWTDTFGTKKPNELKTDIDNLTTNQCKHKPEDLKPVDYDQLKTDLKTKTDELKIATDKITEYGAIKGNYEQLKLINEGLNIQAERLKTEKATLEADKEKLTTDLADKEHTIKEKEKIIEKDKELDTQLTDLNNQLSDKDKELASRNEKIATLTSDNSAKDIEISGRKQAMDDLTAEWKASNQKIIDLLGEKNIANQTIKDLSEKELTLIDDNSQLKQDKEALERTNERLEETNKLLADDYKNQQENSNQLAKDKTELETKLKEKEGELAKVKEQVNTLSQQQGQGQSTAGDDKALKKLVEIYTTEIAERTEFFYQNLSLDNNWINSKYGDANTEYLDKLKGLTADSEPEQVINAFRIVALIVKTEKVQEISDKYKGRLATLPANLKTNNLAKFKKVKETWDLITDEPQEANNPLYLPIIKGRIMIDSQTKKEVDAKIKLNEIINLWQ